MTRIGWTDISQVVRDRLADLDRQPKTPLPGTLAADENLTVMSMSSKQHRVTVTSFKQRLDLGRADAEMQQPLLGRADHKGRNAQIVFDLCCHEQNRRNP